MLTNEQVENIVTKARLSPKDLKLLDEHLEYIGEIYSIYAENLPQDVFQNLEKDLSLIINRLQIEHKRLS